MVAVYTIQSYDERVKRFEAELRGINGDLLSIDGSDDLEERGTTQERLLCDLSVTIKRLRWSKKGEIYSTDGKRNDGYVRCPTTSLESRYHHSMVT